MAETADFDPGDWRGFDFSKARKAYDAHAGRSYGDAVSKGMLASDLVPTSITTACTNPLVIGCDVTGSMGDWPATIFSKLPYLDIEGKEYLGEDLEISFGAIGDVYSDKYPLQVRAFSKGTDHETQLKALIVEGNGGGQHMESYELAALYYARNVRMTSAVRPILVIIGDEAAYDYVDKAHAKSVHVTLEGPRIDTKVIFEELKRKFAVYIVRKQHPGSESMIQNQWVELLGEDHVVILPSADRVVDVIFGILAREMDRIDYFKKEIEGRQKPDQVKTVYKSLLTVHSLPATAPKTAKVGKGKSVMHLPEGKKTKGLLGK